MIGFCYFLELQTVTSSSASNCVTLASILGVSRCGYRVRVDYSWVGTRELKVWDDRRSGTSCGYNMMVVFSTFAEFTVIVVVTSKINKLNMSEERVASVAANVAGSSSRMIIQQCLSATLEVRPPAPDTGAEIVQVFIWITDIPYRTYRAKISSF